MLSNNGLMRRLEINLIKTETRKDKLMSLITCKKFKGGG